MVCDTGLLFRCVFIRKKSIVLGNQEAKIYHACIIGKKFNKEDRILDDTAPVLFRNTQWILNTILKNPFMLF
jgi:hypothetical protein